MDFQGVAVSKINAILQPEFFVEISEKLAKEKSI